MKKMKKIAMFIMVIIILATTSMAVFASRFQVYESNKKVSFLPGKSKVVSNGVSFEVTGFTGLGGDKFIYSRLNYYKQDGLLRTWIERDGKKVTNVQEKVAQAGHRRQGMIHHLYPLESYKGPLTNLELKTTFTPGKIYKMHMPRLVDGEFKSKFNGNHTGKVMTSTFLTVDDIDVVVFAGTQAIGHIDEAEMSLMYLEGMDLHPAVQFYDFAKKRKTPGTFTVTMSSVKGDFKSTIKVHTSKIKDGYIEVPLDSKDNKFLMPAKEVDDIIVKVSFKKD